MSKNTSRMIGLLTMLVSVFFFIGGLYLNNATLPSFVPPACLLVGVVLLAVGLVFYCVIKSE